MSEPIKWNGKDWGDVDKVFIYNGRQSLTLVIPKKNIPKVWRGKSPQPGDVLKVEDRGAIFGDAVVVTDGEVELEGAHSSEGEWICETSKIEKGDLHLGLIRWDGTVEEIYKTDLEDMFKGQTHPRSQMLVSVKWGEDD